jgi:hypothetical protein
MKKWFYQPDMKIYAVYRPWLDRHFRTPVYEDELVAVYRVNYNPALSREPLPKSKEE